MAMADLQPGWRRVYPTGAAVYLGFIYGFERIGKL